MKLNVTIINLLKKLGQARKVKKKASPQSLPPEIMAKVMQEVEFLRNQHSVDVRNLAPGEMPTIPKRADE